MNSKQIKQAISRFRSADVSIIKDDAQRAKAQQLQAKQKGFTLLELLVVITLLAALSVGAMIAYEGIGENAQDTAAANNIVTAEGAIRNYRAVENVYPNQWDNLANLDGELVNVDGDDAGSMALLAKQTKAFFGQWLVDWDDGGGADELVFRAVANSLAAVGINEFQTLTTDAVFTADVVPNLAFNESSPHIVSGSAAASELEISFNLDGSIDEVEWNEDEADTFALSIVPSGGAAGTCTVGGTPISATFDATALGNSERLNLINDALDDDGCHLVLALGFGKDVPGTTLNSRVAISQAPTAASTNINPANQYARYVALFYMGSADEEGATPNVIQPGDILAKPRLIGLVDPEGRNLDQTIAGANATN